MVLWKDCVRVQDPEDQQQPKPNEGTGLIPPHVTSGALKDRRKLIKGLLVIFGCILMFSISNAVQKYGDHKLTFWQLLLYRGISQAVVMFMAHVLTSPSPCWPGTPRTEEEYIIVNQFGINGSYDMFHFILGNRPARSRVILQGFLGGVLLFGLYGAINYIPLASATAIIFSTPLFTFILAVCMLRESCKGYRMIVSLAMILGIILITNTGQSQVELKPLTDNQTAILLLNETKLYIKSISNISGTFSQPPDNLYEEDKSTLILGYFIAVLAPISTALMTIVTRQAVFLGEERPNLMMFWHSLGLLFIVGIAYLCKIADGVPFHNSAKDFGYAYLNIITGSAGNYLLCMSSLYMSPSLANVFRGVEVIIAYVLQVQFENAQVTAGSLMGIFLLLTTAVMISFEEKLARKFHHLGILF